jgi:hypothetical protein
MKGINIFTADVIKNFPYNSSAVKERQQEKKISTVKVFEMMPHGTLKFHIVF